MTRFPQDFPLTSREALERTLCHPQFTVKFPMLPHDFFKFLNPNVNEPIVDEIQIMLSTNAELICTRYY